MRLRFGWIVLLTACLGCHSLQLAEALNEPTPEDDAKGALAAAFWVSGQDAMRKGQIDEAIAFYEQSLQADKSYTHNHLSLAAARLEKGDEEGACANLASYVEAHPEHLAVRGHFGELLLRLKRLPEAREQFERFEIDAQEAGGKSVGQRIQCHSRLTTIAEMEEDEYEEHLHRGIGLYLLAQERAELTDEECSLSAESLLCKSAGELVLARMVRPEEARPCWYLYVVWSSLAQRQPAQHWLREADDKSAFSFLTATEYRELQLARQRDRKDRNF